MLKEISKIYKDKILDGLSQCTEGQVMLFRRMYYHKDLTCPLDRVVGSISDDKLDWALTQVLNTLKKRNSIEVM